MIYTRPIHRHRPAVRILAAFSLVAMLVLGFLGNPPQVHAQVVEWNDPAGLPALNGTTGTGRATPVPLDVKLDGSYPVSVSVSPTLIWRDVPTRTSQVAFTIRTLAEQNPKVIWSKTVAVGSDRTAIADVPAGVLSQGRTYAWQATSTANPSVDNGGPHTLTIDVQRSGTQPVFGVGAVAVAEGTGELVYTYQGPSMNALAGPIGWTLVHRPTNRPQPGLPDGWDLAVTGSSKWDELRRNDDGSMTLSTSAGVSVTYVKRGQDQWDPQVGAVNVAGETTHLSKNDDGTFSATDGNRTVTVFSEPTPNASGRPTRIWSLESPAAQQVWSDGRVRGLIDPVTDNSLAFLYGGEDGCTSTVDPGFVKAPEGMLCAAIDAVGNIVVFQYVEDGNGVQLGRIVSGLGAGIYAASTDIGWDDSGRIVELRNPLAAAAVATDVVGGLGPQDTRVMTQIAYDTSGRVASLTTPAGLIAGAEQPEAREERAKMTFTYAPFTVRSVGVSTPTGFDLREWLDPVTLQVVKKADESGNAMTYDYDPNGNLVKVVGLTTGSQVVTRYDRYGRPIEQIGPTRGTLTSPTAPRTTTAYDQDEQGRDWKGLAVRYWSNAGFNGVPADGSTGPTVGGSVVAGLQFNWPGNPTGGSGPWSARLSGTYEAQAAGAYRFENLTSAKLWVNGRLCANACTTPIAAGGAANIQIDVVSPAGAAAGVKVMVTRPDGTQTVASTDRLRPNYGLATSSTVRENTGDGARTLTTKMVFNPLTTQLLKTISPSGATMTRTYEPYDPANDQWGRSTSVTDASGKTTTSTYYAKNTTATDCNGQQVDQSGAVKSVDLAGGGSISQVVGPDGGSLAGTDGVATSCSTAAQENLGFASTTTGLGEEVTTYSLPTIAGNPLVSADVAVVGDAMKIDVVARDTNGNVWKSIDAQGTTTVRQWDAARGYLTRVIETPKGGESRTTEYTYAPSGQVATVTVNGNRLATNVYATDGTLQRTELGNGSVQTFELDQNNNPRQTTTRFPNGTTLSESMVRSPSGRLLSRTIAGPSGTSTYTYDYNADGRLIDTKLSGTIPAAETRWQNAYTGPDGLNGNRASETTTRADGSASTATFAYGSDNRLLSAAGERFTGQIEYDAAGRATKIGDVGLAYDAAGHLLSAGDAQRSYTFSDAGATTTLTRTIDGAQTTLTATTSGESLILGGDGKLDGQIINPVNGVKVILDQNGDPTRWVYDDAIGNGTWTSRGDAAPTKTHLYSPDGEAVSVLRTSDPKTPLDLVLDGLGWQSGTGASTLRLSTPITIIGDRSYTPDGGRWLQPDPTIGGSMNAYEYAIGDPINLNDPTGNAPPWGMIGGLVAAAVVGVLIGSLTFGIGTAATASYGIGAFVAQVAVGAVVGFASGAAGDVAEQFITHGGVTDWTSVLINAGFGAASGAAFAGASAAITKVWAPRKLVRAKGMTQTNRGYAGLRQQFDEANIAYSKGMFTKGSWQKDYAKLQRWTPSAIEDAGGLKRMLLTGGDAEKLAKLNAKSGNWKFWKKKPERASVRELDEFKDFFGGRTSVAANVAAADDVVLVSQRQVSTNSIKSNVWQQDPQSPATLKRSLLEQVESSSKKTSVILDDIERSQHSSYNAQKRFRDQSFRDPDELPMFYNQEFVKKYVISIFN